MGTNNHLEGIESYVSFLPNIKQSKFVFCNFMFYFYVL
jgi:hypothetical protein